MTAVLLVVDMQIGSFTPREAFRHADGLVDRLNTLAAETRARNGRVIFVRHDGPPGDAHHPDAPGWHLLPELIVAKNDTILPKQSCDAFLNTGLDEVLRKTGTTELVITGSATDYCVDTTVRAALARSYQVTVPSDGHTCRNRPHLSAAQIIAHHNAIWADFIAPRGPARVCPSAKVFAP